MPIGTEPLDPHVYYNRGRGRPSDLMNSLLDRTISSSNEREQRDSMNESIESMGAIIRQVEMERGLRTGRVGMGGGFVSSSVDASIPSRRYTTQVHDEVISPSVRLSSDEIRHMSTAEERSLRSELFRGARGSWNSLGPTETNDHTIFNQIMSRYPPFHERTDVDKERLTEELVELLVYRS